MRHGSWWAALVLGWSLSGCTSFVTRQIEHPGRAHSRSADAFLTRAGFQRETVHAGSAVRIAYWVAEPKAYRIKDEYQVRRQGERSVSSINFGFEEDPTRALPLASRGSIVLLHPWSMNGAAMTVWGIHFAAAGFQVVMPDLRSHGDSSDAAVGYGPREAGDIVTLVRDLRASHRLPEPLYLLGVSYGATVALFAAPQLPGLRGVVALEPYANAARVIRRAPASDLFGHRWLARWISADEINAAITRASRHLDVDLEQVGPGDALAQTRACTLMLRGSRDALISGEALATLSRRSARATYVEVPDEGHVSLPVRTAWLVPPLLEWMRALPVAGGSCPAFSLPPIDAAPASARVAGAQPRR